MELTLEIAGQRLRADLTRPFDISIPLVPDATGPNAFYASPFRVEPVRAGTFVGDTDLGGPVNFKDIRMNPHGNGTHTECVGHIASGPWTIAGALQDFLFPARLVTIFPQRREDGDKVVTADQLLPFLDGAVTPAFVLRTQPNGIDKARRNWSGSNPTYLEAAAARLLADSGVEHLLLDLPSVDREEDGGALAAHRAYWRYPDAVRDRATITEMVYVPDELPDGLYLLNLQVLSLVLDASPSRPVLYPLLPLP